MTGALVVLVITVIYLLAWLVALAATWVLARRNGQRLKSMTWSPITGYTAEFFPSAEERKAEKTIKNNA